MEFAWVAGTVAGPFDSILRRRCVPTRDVGRMSNVDCSLRRCCVPTRDVARMSNDHASVAGPTIVAHGLMADGFLVVTTLTTDIR